MYSDMTIIPQQYFGAGDAIFIQSLLKQIGGKVLYPILPQFVEGFNRAYPDVTFIDYRMLNINYESKVEVVQGDTRILPIRYADQILKVPYHHCMRAKYDLYDIDYTTWRDVMFKRDVNREIELRNEVGAVGEYNLISCFYGSGAQFQKPIEPDNGLVNVYMRNIEGYSLFDWSYIIQNATTIHAVSSSIVYLLELLDLKAAEVHLYGRHHEPKTWLKNIEYLLTKKYEIHE